jgi:hypothetical protein
MYNQASIRAHLLGGGSIHIVPRDERTCSHRDPEADMLVYFKDEDGKEEGFISLPLRRFTADVWDHGDFRIEVEFYTDGGDLSIYASPRED